MGIMPRYDFLCEFCSTQVELTLAVDQQVPRCNICRGLLRRLWSTVPIHFKGDGWAGKK
jgi:putative FmdB family regulatory protein